MTSRYHGNKFLDHDNGEFKQAQRRRSRQREQLKSNKFILAKQKICTWITFFTYIVAVARMRHETS